MYDFYCRFGIVFVNLILVISVAALTKKGAFQHFLYLETHLEHKKEPMFRFISVLFIGIR